MVYQDYSIVFQNEPVESLFDMMMEYWKFNTMNEKYKQDENNQVSTDTVQSENRNNGSNNLSRDASGA